MGETVPAAKCTHVPTMRMSEQPGRLSGMRQAAIDGHREISRRAKELGADTIVILDTHWMMNAGCHINANHRFRGVLTLCHQLDSLQLEYGTLAPIRFMSRERGFKVVSDAAWCNTHGFETSRMIGKAIREAIKESDNKVLLVASGSLSHQMWSNDEYEANNGTFTIFSEFNPQMDLHVLDMWKRGDIATFNIMLPEYAEQCSGEEAMHDTAMLLGALGWDHDNGKAEVVTDYFPSSGTGQVDVIFPVLS